MPDFGIGFMWLLFVLCCLVVAGFAVLLGIAVAGGVQWYRSNREKEKEHGDD